jgi:glycyl-tRNA synthetase
MVETKEKKAKEIPLEETLNELAKRRGFFYMSNEIYGGLTGFYDYGSVGTLIKRNIESLWRKHFLSIGENSFEIEPTDVMAENVFVASGHIKNFIDPSVRCKKEGIYYRADHIIGNVLKKSVEGKSAEELSKLIKEHKIRCPKCGGELADVKVLNMMLPIKLGAEGDTIAYLRPETAQGVYVNFLRQFNIQRGRMPMGLAIVGKAFRNEISPRQLLIRQREFTQAELQIFFDPEKINEAERWDEVSKYHLKVLFVGEGEAKKKTCEELVSKDGLPKFYVYHMAKMQQFFIEVLGLPEEKFRLRELDQDEKAFYNKIHFDVEIYLESLHEYKELGGVHYRTDHDLKGHQDVSKKSQEIFYEGKRFIPHILELSTGIDRTFYACMELSYRHTSEREWEWFAFPPKVAPFQFAVYPLVGKDNVPEAAERVYRELKANYAVVYDDSGSIGRRYARADEIGIPYSITADYDTLKDDSVTVRNRDTMKQIRVKIKDIGKEAAKLAGLDSLSQ